jgi:hypothetical protein
LSTVAGLNLARALLWSLAITASVGAYAFAFSRAQISALEFERGKLYAMLLPLLVLIGWCWSTLNWYLKLALVPAARDDHGVIDALQTAGGAVRQHGRQFLWIGLVIALLRGVLFMVGIFFFLIVFSVALQSPGAVGITVVAFYAWLWIVLFTFLHLLQLAAYARVFAWAGESRSAIVSVV